MKARASFPLFNSFFTEAKKPDFIRFKENKANLVLERAITIRNTLPYIGNLLSSKKHPESPIEMINLGLPSETFRGLQSGPSVVLSQDRLHEA